MAVTVENFSAFNAVQNSSNTSLILVALISELLSPWSARFLETLAWKMAAGGSLYISIFEKEKKKERRRKERRKLKINKRKESKKTTLLVIT